uniref:TLC domain-containing protein n=1 Tax=Parascaris equorum TaxID=6256 RepID=A0A914RLG0_PAREQ
MWNPEFWLPRNVTWDQLPTHSEDLVYPIMLTFPILGLRILFESFVGIPCGFYLGYGTGTLTEQIKRHLFFGFASNTRSKRILDWMINFIRVGTLILILHDVSDISLELAKLVHYDEANAKYANAIFFIFLISWTLTRIGYFPLVVIRSAIFDAPTLIQSDYDLFNPFEVGGDRLPFLFAFQSNLIIDYQ